MTLKSFEYRASYTGCLWLPNRQAQLFFEKEQFDRSFYTGYFGRLHPTEKTTFYVNLRAACKFLQTTKHVSMLEGNYSKKVIPNLNGKKRLPNVKQWKLFFNSLGWAVIKF